MERTAGDEEFRAWGCRHRLHPTQFPKVSFCYRVGNKIKIAAYKIKLVNVGTKESCLSSGCWQSGEMVDSVSLRNHLQRFCSAMKVVKGRRGGISVSP